MAAPDRLTDSDRTVLIEMFCCVIAADKKISGKEVQVVVDALASMGCDTSSGTVKNEVVEFCKAIHKKGVDAYVADLLPTLTSKSGTQLAKLFIDAQKGLLEADGQATSDEKIVSECLVTALQHPLAEAGDKQEADVVLEDAAPSATAAVAGAAKSTAAMAGAAAERTKLLTISLPAAYLTLGKHCAEQRIFSQEFPDLYAALAKLAAEMAATSEKLSRSSGATTFAVKAQDLAGKGVQLALAKKQSLQQQKLLHDLGKKVYETKGASSGPSELTAKIAQIRDRVAALGASVGNSAQALKESATAVGRSASGSAGKAKKVGFLQSPWLIAISSFVFAPLGLLLIWLHPSWPKRTKYLWASFAVACFCGIGYFQNVRVEATRKRIASADALWNEGKRSDAAEQYHLNVSMLSLLPKSEQAEVYGRLIEYEGSVRNSSKVQPLLEAVAEARIELPATFGGARQLVSEYQREVEAKKQAAIAERERRKREKAVAKDSDTPAPQKSAAQLKKEQKEMEEWERKNPDRVRKSMQDAAAARRKEKYMEELGKPSWDSTRDPSKYRP